MSDTTSGDLIRAERDIFANNVKELMEAFTKKTGLFIIDIDFLSSSHQTARDMGSRVQQVVITKIVIEDI